MTIFSSKNLVAVSVFVILTVPLSLAMPDYVYAGYCSSCRACTRAAIASAHEASKTAFIALHASIKSLGSVFLVKSQELAIAFNASSSNITTGVNVASRSEKQLYDALNSQQEIRSQQIHTLEKKRQLEEDHNVHGLNQNLQLAYATQENLKLSEYTSFVDEFVARYDVAIKSNRESTLSSYIATDEMLVNSELLWAGDIKTPDEAANVIFLTQQLLFQGDKDPYEQLIEDDRDVKGLNRDQAALLSVIHTWKNRLQPSVDMFAFDQAIRTWPDDETPSLFNWLEQNVSVNFTNSEALTELYSNSSRANLLRGLAVEKKKANLIQYLKFKNSLLSEKIVSAKYANENSLKAQGLRRLTKES